MRKSLCGAFVTFLGQSTAWCSVVWGGRNSRGIIHSNEPRLHRENEDEVYQLDDPDDPNNELCKKKLDLALSCAFTVEVLPPPRVTVVKKEMNLALSCVFTVEVLPPVHSASIFTM